MPVFQEIYRSPAGRVFQKKGNIMTGVARYFMITGVLSVLAGMIWGIQMSASGDHGLSPAHAHLNLLGWVTCAIYAVYYHVVPTASDGPVPVVHLAVTVSGLILIVPGIVMALTGQGETLAKLGSVLCLLSMVIFSFVVLKGAPSRVSSQAAKAS